MKKMNSPLKNAIYYISPEELPDYLRDTKITYDYENDTFSSIMTEFKDDINIRTLIDTSYYHLFDRISKEYNNLLLDKVESLFIVNRMDESICMLNKNINSDTDSKIAILKLDSVAYEYGKTTSYKHKSWWLLGIGMLLTGVLFYENSNLIYGEN